MAASIQTANGVLASGIHDDNPGSTITESGGIWTASHATKLTVTAAVGHRAGYCFSYPTSPVFWGGSNLRTIVHEGHIAKHDFNCMVVETGAGTDAAYVNTYQPTREESQRESTLL